MSLMSYRNQSVPVDTISMTCGQKWGNRLFTSGDFSQQPWPSSSLPLPRPLLLYFRPRCSDAFKRILSTVRFLQVAVSNKETAILGPVFLGTCTSLAHQDEKVDISNWQREKDLKKCTFSHRCYFGQPLSLWFWLIALAIEEINKEESLVFRFCFPMGNLKLPLDKHIKVNVA